MKAKFNTKGNSTVINFSKATVLIIALVMAAVNNVQAQDSSVYKKLRFEFNTGASVTEKKLDGLQPLTGWVTLEPNYALNDKVAVGIQYKYISSFSYDGKQVSTKDNNIIMATVALRSAAFNSAPWIFNKDKERLAFELGIGFNTYRNKVDTGFFALPVNEKVNYTGSGFAFMPRLAYETGKFTMEVNYTYTGNKGANFLGLGFGFFFGGGKKNK